MPTKHQRYQKALNELNDAYDWIRWNPTDPLAIRNLQGALAEYTTAWKEFAEVEVKLAELQATNGS